MTETTAVKKPSESPLLKKTSNYLKIVFHYNLTIVLPYKEGMALLSTLEVAEKYNTDNYDHPKITVIDYDQHSITSEIISQEQYLKCKMSALLNIN